MGVSTPMRRLLTTAALAGLALCASPALAQGQCTAPPSTTPPADGISYTRLLRRVSLALTGTTPTAAQYEAMAAAATPEAKEALLQQSIDELLASPRFYEAMVNFGHEWLAIGAYTKGAQGDAYQGDMSGHLFACPSGTVHAGALYQVGEYAGDRSRNVCDDQDASGASLTAEVHTVEPWWAPGTTVTVVGKGGSAVTQVTDAMGQTVDCGIAHGGYYDPALASGCGCGPNLVWCSPLVGLNSSSNHDLSKQRRHPYEEPARLFAHLAWYDRPLSDLVVGNYSVGTNWLRALYVRAGRQQGSGSDANTTWWRAGQDPSPRDPSHPTPDDPQAWREFVVEDLNPYLLALSPNRAPSGDLSRSYAFDPRTTTDPPRGLPAAGVLTMMGALSAYPRERVRAARFLETFACSTFNPPPTGVSFPPYAGDPATGGTCMHCHRTLDPAAIFFKRWDFGAESYYVPWPFMPGVGRWRITPAWVSGKYPHSAADHSPGFRWKNAFVPGTVMTPTTEAEATANAEALLLDTMPSSYTLLGQHGDGTMGPLGFGKILVRSGEFDRCAVRKLYARMVGRDLDPAAERLYIDALASDFVAGGRKVKPFLRLLMQQPEFRRGL